MSEGEILANMEFDYPFAGKTYKLKRANLRLVMEWQRKSVEISKVNDGTQDLQLAAYALYLALHNADPSVTEEFVLENASGDIDVMATLKLLGFMNQQKVEMMQKIKDALGAKPTGESSTDS